MALAEGDRVLDRFVIGRVLAARDSSETYLARDESSSEPAVVRALWLRGTRSWKALELLEREAKVLESLSEPGIPRLLAFGHMERGDNLVFLLAKEYIEGESLQERVSRGPLSEQEAASIGAGVATILGSLHQRVPPVIHRDVKPSNIIIRPEDLVWLIDFGAVTDPARLDDGGSTIIGTYGYIAPEQVVGGGAAPAADLYSLGATLLFARSGRDPSTAPREGLEIRVREVLPEGALTRLVGELLDPDPRRRPGSAEVVASRLLFIAGRATPAEPEADGAEPTERWKALREAWDDSAAHDAFIAWCNESEQLPFAGHCYRTILDVSPDDPMAQRGRDRVLAQAMALLSLETRDGPDWKRVAVVVRAATLIIVLGAISVLIAWLFLRR